MNKIILAINSMIENSDEISVVVGKNNEYIFSYQGSIWSIFEYNDPESGYSLVLYPRTKSISQLESLDNPRFNTPHIIYSSGDLKTQEALESFHELYNILKEKVYGVDDILNKIIMGSKTKKKTDTNKD